MQVVETKDFQKNFHKLSPEIQKLYAKQKERFLDYWLDPRLHLKRVKEMPGVYSFRVTRRYRVLFYFSEKRCQVPFSREGKN